MYANYILLAKLPIAKNYPERENTSFFVINNYKLGPILAIFGQKTKDIVIVNPFYAIRGICHDEKSVHCCYSRQKSFIASRV